MLAKLEATIRVKLATLSTKSALVFYCEDGRVKISNVLAENALRCVALGRKNYLFVGSTAGASEPPRCMA